ncbi:MAG: peptide ABC transporter substrate-binding protein, partial [Spirochaetales bacterium]|nr:peptide ABC transporter substrate-binding protein [Spirochaetales bacterium]
MRKFALVLGLTAMTAIAVFAGGGQEGPASDISEFIIGNGAEPESLDPHLISGVPEHRIMMGLFEGLVVPDPETATAIPGVAESWEVSDDGTM